MLVRFRTVEGQVALKTCSVLNNSSLKHLSNINILRKIGKSQDAKPSANSYNNGNFEFRGGWFRWKLRLYNSNNIVNVIVEPI